MRLNRARTAERRTSCSMDASDREARGTSKTSTRRLVRATAQGWAKNSPSHDHGNHRLRIPSNAYSSSSPSASSSRTRSSSDLAIVTISLAQMMPHDQDRSERPPHRVGLRRVGLLARRCDNVAEVDRRSRWVRTFCLALFVLPGLLLAGCGGGSEATADFRGGGLSFSYPRTWQSEDGWAGFMGLGAVAFLSTERLHPACKILHHANGQVTGSACRMSLTSC